jgi:hypothetical protein
VYFKNRASNLQQGGLSHELEEAHRVVRVQGGVRAEGEPHFRTVPNLGERTIKKKTIETIFFSSGISVYFLCRVTSNIISPLYHQNT